MQRIRELWETDRGRLAHYVVVAPLVVAIAIAAIVAIDADAVYDASAPFLLLDGVRAAGLPVELDVEGAPRELSPGVGF